MIARCVLNSISASNINNYMDLAASSGCMYKHNQRDCLRMFSLKTISSNTSTTPSSTTIRLRKRTTLLVNKLTCCCCSGNYHGNVTRNNTDSNNTSEFGGINVNGGLHKAASRGGNATGVIGTEKITIAVDVDEVLGNFVSALNQFIVDRYSLNHSVSEYHVYEFFKIWNCSRDEADIRVHEFFNTPYFKKGIYPIPGARKALRKISEFCNLSIVTSRQNAIKEHTIEWIEKHYPGLFWEFHFGNHFALDGQSRSKSDMCKSLGAKVLIDDNPKYAIECAEVGIKVLLFDYENSYPWCKTDYICQHPLVTKVRNWEEVEHQLAALIVS